MRSGLRSERTCFEADRSVLIRKLEAVGNAIENSASEMAMFAGERVFEERISKVLSGEARAMYRMVREIEGLGLAVSRARLTEPRK